MLGETCNGDVEVVTILLADVPYEINPMNESSLNCFPLVFAQRWVTTQCKDVPTPVGFGILEGCECLVW